MTRPAETHALSARLDRLNEAIERVERALRQLNLGVSSTVPLDLGDFTKGHLGYGKIGGNWRLFVVQGDEVQRPLTSASQETRLAAATRLDDLLAAMLDAEHQRSDAVEVAIKHYQTFADHLAVAAEAEEQP